jgi:hypothetical protein
MKKQSDAERFISGAWWDNCESDHAEWGGTAGNKINVTKVLKKRSSLVNENGTSSIS